MEKFELDNGKILVKDFGKYASGLCFICDNDDIKIDEYDKDKFYLKWNKIDYDLNLNTNTYCIRGEFFISKNKTKCFRINKDGKHVLLNDRWGGAFSTYRGERLKTLPDLLYEHRASSNGGGCGIDYAVIEYGKKNVISEDDI